jgi:hypothetical protein
MQRTLGSSIQVEAADAEALDWNEALSRWVDAEEKRLQRDRAHERRLARLVEDHGRSALHAFEPHQRISYVAFDDRATGNAEALTARRLDA